MKAFYSYFPNGKIMTSGTCQDHCLDLQSFPGATVVEGSGIYGIHYHSDNGEIVELGLPKDQFQVFDYSVKLWVDPRTLQDHKATKAAEINGGRLNANQSTFPFSGKLIAVDQLSRSDIDAVHGIVVLTNAMPDNWVGGWKTVDNSYVSIPDVAKWTLFYKAMVGQGSINFAHAQALKTRLVAAKTVDEIDAIVW